MADSSNSQHVLEAKRLQPREMRFKGNLSHKGIHMIFITQNQVLDEHKTNQKLKFFNTSDKSQYLKYINDNKYLIRIICIAMNFVEA